MTVETLQTKDVKNLSSILSITTNDYPYKTWGEMFPDYKVDLLSLLKNTAWKPFFENNPYLLKIQKSLSVILKKTEGKVKIYPYPELVFHTFNLLDPEEIKVVIIGQDPYIKAETHNKKEIPEAMGLSFSVPAGIKVPPSLANIYKNLKHFKHILKTPDHGDLTMWALQGVFMINASLTVQAGISNSHAKYWQEFTDSVIAYINESCKNLMFVLWGTFAIGKQVMIGKQHKVIKSSHPSPLGCNTKSATMSCFTYYDHFKEINKHLKKMGCDSIIWQNTQ
jgi:uracil-DNA glycosylase